MHVRNKSDKSHILNAINLPDPTMEEIERKYGDLASGKIIAVDSYSHLSSITA
jgi:hypothetical protein